MTPFHTLKVTTPSEREILMTRAFQAPRHLVFRALTEPALVKRWLTGMPGWSLEVCEIDLRVGGKYRYQWHGKDGARMGMGGEYVEVEPPHRIVATEVFDDAWYPGMAVVTMELSEEGDVTMLRETVLYQSREARDGVLETPMEQGVAFSFDQLEALLTTLG